MVFYLQLNIISIIHRYMWQITNVSLCHIGTPYQELIEIYLRAYHAIWPGIIAYVLMCPQPQREGHSIKKSMGLPYPPGWGVWGL